MNPFTVTALAGALTLIVALGWLAIVAFRSQRIRNRVMALNAHPVAKAAQRLAGYQARIQSDAAEMASLRDRLQRLVASVGADIETIVTTAARVVALIRVLRQTMANI